MHQVMITFDLQGADSAKYLEAHRVFATLGFFVSSHNVVLPSSTVIGTWWAPTDAVALRAAILQHLKTFNIPVSALAIVIFEQAAWWRAPDA
jgi:hypothetical protein